MPPAVQRLVAAALLLLSSGLGPPVSALPSSVHEESCENESYVEETPEGVYLHSDKGCTTTDTTTVGQPGTAEASIQNGESNGSWEWDYFGHDGSSASWSDEHDVAWHGSSARAGGVELRDLETCGSQTERSSSANASDVTFRRSVWDGCRRTVSLSIDDNEVATVERREGCWATIDRTSDATRMDEDRMDECGTTTSLHSGNGDVALHEGERCARTETAFWNQGETSDERCEEGTALTGPAGFSAFYGVGCDEHEERTYSVPSTRQTDETCFDGLIVEGPEGSSARVGQQDGTHTSCVASSCSTSTDDPASGVWIAAADRSVHVPGGGLVFDLIP